jgi:hypothetical protein
MYHDPALYLSLSAEFKRNKVVLMLTGKLKKIIIYYHT